MPQKTDEGTTVPAQLSMTGGLIGAIIGARDGPVGAAVGGVLGGTTGYALGHSVVQRAQGTDKRPVTIEITDSGASSSTTQSSE